MRLYKLPRLMGSCRLFQRFILPTIKLLESGEIIE